jgi:lysophospholipase L1-like esterase
MERMRRRAVSGIGTLLAIVALMGAGVAVVVSPIGVPSAGAASSTSTAYVALGDSYSAGPLAGLSIVGNPIGCARSLASYPYLVAAALHVKAFRNATCSSATTSDFTAAQQTPDGTNPPQFAFLGPDTSLVTVGIGGNDADLVGVATSCLNLVPVDLGPAPEGHPCVDHYTAGGVDQVYQDIMATGPKIAAALQTIRRLAPKATIVVVGYPAVLPVSGIGCWPYVPLLNPDVAYLRDKLEQMDIMLSAEAAANGAVVANDYSPFFGHDVCQLPGNNWVDGIVPIPPAFPLHPNANGEAAMARAVEAVVRSSGWTP